MTEEQEIELDEIVFLPESKSTGRLTKLDKIKVACETINFFMSIKSKVIVPGEHHNSEYSVFENEDHKDIIDLWIMELGKEVKEQVVNLLKK